jgi:hypothetical protein
MTLRRHHNSNRRKLEFQTGVTERIGDRALSTSGVTLAYTPHHASRSLRPGYRAEKCSSR